MAVIEDKQAICRDDNDTLMGIFAPGYAMHQYREWLLTTVANILDDDLSISSAGLLRGGAVAWVEVSVPESITTPEGVVFRPNLLATTSFDGSIATTFKRTVTDVVCDNTRETALAEQGQTYKVKHSRYSRAQLGARPRGPGAWCTPSRTTSPTRSPGCCATTVTSPTVGEVPRRLRPAGSDQDGLPLTGQGARPWPTRSATPCSGSTGTTSASLPGQAPPTVSSRPSTPTSTTRAPCAAPSRAERNMLRTVTGDWVASTEALTQLSFAYSRDGRGHVVP